VVLVVQAHEAAIEVRRGVARLKSVPIKSLAGQPLPFDEYVARMREEARSEYRQWLHQHRGWRQGQLWAG
jgi:hypothetical protein